MNKWKKIWLYCLTVTAWGLSQVGLGSAQNLQKAPENTGSSESDIYLMPASKTTDNNAVNTIDALFSNDIVEYSHYSHSSHASHYSHTSHYSGSGYYYGGDSSDSSNASSSSSSNANASEQSDVIPITQIQQQLNDLGYDCGSVDGEKGPGTTSAIEAFQSDYSLTVNGIVDSVTESYLDSTNISIVRAALEKNGYDCGDSDTRNQKTISAIYDFQARHNIPADGRINPATKTALNI